VRGATGEPGRVEAIAGWMEGESRPLAGRLPARLAIAPQGEDGAQAAFPQIDACPDKDAKENGKDRFKRRAAGAHLDCDCAAEKPSQHHRAEDCGAGNQVKERTHKEENSDPGVKAHR
jgi:hypothetical protein